MNELKLKNKSLAQRKKRIRAKVSGSSIRPRLSVKISYRNITVQLIDDQKGITIEQATSIGNKKIKDMNLTNKASEIGNEIAQKALNKKISSVVFDRNGKIYHGRIKALAEAARKAGLEI